MENLIKFYFSKLLVTNHFKHEFDASYLVIKTGTDSKSELVKFEKNIFGRLTKSTRKEIRDKVIAMANPFVASLTPAPDPEFTYVIYDCSFNKKEHNVLITSRYAPRMFFGQHSDTLDFHGFSASKFKDTLSKSEINQIYKSVFPVS